MRLSAILVASLALLISFAWLIFKPGFDSSVAVASALAALLAAFFLKRTDPAKGQTQNLSGSSVGIQAGRDANVQDISNN